MKIGILKGDDIGHEVVPEAVKVMQAAALRAGLAIDWQPVPIGRRALDTLGSTLPADTLSRLEQLDGWILVPIGHQAYPKIPEAINPHPILRKHFD
jgi:3-isopropylmalate dehydrogenase